MVRSLDPQEMADVSVQMQSPVSPGMYQGQWRMCTATGLYYGGEDSKSYIRILPLNVNVAECCSKQQEQTSVVDEDEVLNHLVCISSSKNY